MVGSWRLNGEVREAEAERHRRGAVDKIVVDRETARHERGILAADAGNGNAGRRGQGVLQREQVLRLDLLLVDDRDGVGDVLQRRDGLADRLPLPLPARFQPPFDAAVMQAWPHQLA